MNFDIKSTKGAAEAGQRITAGIHTCKFMGVSRGTVESKDGKVFDVVTLTVNINDYGEFKHNFFVPTEDSDAQRTEGAFGQNPSKAEHFLIAMREIIAAVDSDADKAIENDEPIMVDDDEVKLSGSFAQFFKGMKKITDPHIGEEVEIKLIPQSNGFVAVPPFCARITKKGDLGKQTVFIGHNLTLSPREQRDIENAKNATPTNMASKTKSDDMLNELKKDLKEEGDDDLPF